jgi:hypothetical protein
MDDKVKWELEHALKTTDDAGRIANAIERFVEARIAEALAKLK